MVETTNLLTDEQMSDFITKGYLVLKNDLPQQLHQGIMDKIYHVLHEEGNPGNNILPRIPDIQQLFDTPVVQGALTSVLGEGYYMHPHRHCHYNQPGNQTPGGGQWHKDGYWSSMRSHRPWWAMIFYYTHDITEELGPTAIMPGTQYYEKWIGEKGETLLPTGKAGTMVLVHFDLWHKASLNVTNMDRYMLKFQFIRTSAPEYPSWNHQGKELSIPVGTPATHFNLWQDVWHWLLGETKTASKMSRPDEMQIAAWMEALLSADEKIRAEAADELGLLGEAAITAVPALSSLVCEGNEITALNAAYALGHLGPQGIEALIEIISTGSELAAQRAAYGLQGAGKDAIPAIIRLINQQDNERRRALAAFLLGMIGVNEDGVIPALITSLQDESDWVRRNAIEALGQIRQADSRTAEVLAEVLVSSVRNEAMENSRTSEKRGDYVGNQTYITNKIAYTAVLSLLRLGQSGNSKQVVHAIEQALYSRDRYVRAYAAEALTRIRSEEAVHVLIQYYRMSRWCPDTSKASTF